MKYLGTILIIFTPFVLLAQGSSTEDILANTQKWSAEDLSNLSRNTKTWTKDYIWEIPDNSERNAMPFYKPNFNPKKVNFYIASDFKVFLNWRVKKELGVSHYEVERFEKSKRFELMQVLGANHSQVNTEPYFFKDDRPVKGISNYRIVQVLQTGERRYSSIYSINFDRPIEDIVLLNFPKKRSVEVLALKDKKPISIFFYNDAGKIIAQHSFKNRIQIRTLEWPKGMVRYDVLGDGYEAHGLVKID